MKYVPTMQELLDAYVESATVERMKSERPCARTVSNVLVGVRVICRTVCPADEDWRTWPVSMIDHRRIDRYLTLARVHGLSPVTAWGYLQSLKGLTARWTLRYYADRGWKITPFEVPPCRRRAPRYIRPDHAVLRRVRSWYEALEHRADKREWLTATLMLEFAMRNGDIATLCWSDFRLREDLPSAIVLCYTPHKTALSSGRIVSWPVHPDIWSRMVRIRERTAAHGRIIPNAELVFARLNSELRDLKLFTGTKALYELRKICIDHVYQKFGAEMASSISGDDIRTVTRYYADPSAVNIAGGVRIVELL
ncbi:MAG: hypothetical protein IKO72_01590 [Kiritimatiellae bacterium]|nr:hypothetical protein [Kiritimatiellia bacterium]